MILKIIKVTKQGNSGIIIYLGKSQEFIQSDRLLFLCPKHQPTKARHCNKHCITSISKESTKVLSKCGKG